MTTPTQAQNVSSPEAIRVNPAPAQTQRPGLTEFSGPAQNDVIALRRQLAAETRGSALQAAVTVAESPVQTRSSAVRPDVQVDPRVAPPILQRTNAVTGNVLKSGSGPSESAIQTGPSGNVRSEFRPSVFPPLTIEVAHKKLQESPTGATVAAATPSVNQDPRDAAYAKAAASVTEGARTAVTSEPPAAEQSTASEPFKLGADKRGGRVVVLPKPDVKAA